MKLLSLVCFVVAATAHAGEPRLEPYRIVGKSVTISGISSGAFMAVQMHIAFSKTISGVGSVAGGIYGCAEGSAEKAQIDCMFQPQSIQVEKFVTKAKADARDGEIDSLDHLTGHRAFIFAGSKDTVIRPAAGAKLKEFYDAFLGQKNIRFENQVPAGHGFPTRQYGNSCEEQKTPWMNKCDYDAAGEILKAMYGPLKERTKAVDGHLRMFSQGEFAPSGVPLFSHGWVYVPSSCARGEVCKLHLALHGCSMNPEDIQDQFARHAGYNEWAEANRIIVLYPQAAKLAKGNPFGCWDWFGYTGKNYAVRSGPQMAALKKMIDRISSR